MWRSCCRNMSVGPISVGARRCARVVRAWDECRAFREKRFSKKTFARKMKRDEKHAVGFDRAIVRDGRR